MKQIFAPLLTVLAIPAASSGSQTPKLVIANKEAIVALERSAICRGLGRRVPHLALLAVCWIWAGFVCSLAQSTVVNKADAGPQKIIIDTDIGDDVDDAFAVSLALQSAEFKIVAITTAWGDTNLRARLVDRLLKEVGRSDIPVAVGIEKHGPGQADFTQARWAEAGPAAKAHSPAVDFLLEQIRSQPGEITLVAIAPLTNIGAAIDRDPATFRKLKRVVMMGGSVYRGLRRFRGGQTRTGS